MIEVKNHFARHLMVWVVLLLLYVLASPVFMSKATFSVAADEQHYLESIGVDVQKASDRAGRTFHDWFIDTGVKKSVDQVFKPSKSTDKNHPGHNAASVNVPSFGAMFKFSSGYIDALWSMIFIGLIRLHMLWPIMLSVLVCMGVPCLVDGVVTRAKKSYNFEYHNPVYFWTSGHAFVTMIGVSLAIPFLPFSITMGAVAVFTLVLSVSIWMVAANFQTGV